MEILQIPLVQLFLAIMLFLCFISFLFVYWLQSKQMSVEPDEDNINEWEETNRLLEEQKKLIEGKE